jgi:hypothetical protein
MAQNQKLRTQVQEHAQYLGALNRKLDQIVSLLAQHGETLAAIVSQLGEEVIESKMLGLRADRRQKHEDKLEQSVLFGIENGFFIPTAEGATVGLEHFVVGSEISADGSIARTQLEMKRLDRAGQARYFGKKVGDEIVVEGAPTKIVIQAIYVLDMAKLTEMQIKQKEAALATQSNPTVEVKPVE